MRPLDRPRLRDIERQHAPDDQQTPDPKPPSHRIIEKGDADHGREDHFHGHEDAAFQAGAVEKAVVHEQLGGEGRQNDAAADDQLIRGPGEHRAGRVGREGDHHAHGA